MTKTEQPTAVHLYSDTVRALALMGAGEQNRPGCNAGTRASNADKQ